MLKLSSILFTLLLAADLHAVTFTWDANPELDIAGYILHYGTNSGQYIASTNVGNVTNFVFASSNLFAGTNFFALTAYFTNSLESDFSNEIFIRKPAKPRNFRLSLESSDAPAGPWTEIAAIDTPVDWTGSQRFYRGRLSQ